MKSRFLFLILIAGISPTTTPPQTPAGASGQVLQLDTVIESETRGQDQHAYQIQISAGQYVRIAIDHRDLLLRVRLVAPDGGRLLEMLAPYSAQEPAHVSLIAPTSGRYLIELGPVKEEATPKHYSLRIEELRAATSSDQDRATAERLFAEAETLRVNASADALRSALEKYRAAVDLWRGLKLQSEEAYALLVLGSVSHNLSRPKEAISYYSDALALWRSLGNRAKEAHTLSGLGWTYYSIGDLRHALEHYNEALPIRRELADLRGQAQTLTTIGQIYRSLGDPQKAFEYYNQSLPLARQTDDKIQEAFALDNIAFLHTDLAEYQTALNYLDQSLPLWRETGNQYGEADALNSAGVIYDELGDFDRALELFDQALTIWRHLGNQLGEADALNNSGIVYLSQAELQGSSDLLRKAVDVLDQALAVRRTTGQLLGETDTLVNLGLAYEKLGERDKALGYFNQVLTIDSRSPTALHNIGINYYFRHDSQRALEYFRRALQIFKERGNRTGEAQTLRMIAEVQSGLGSLTEALTNSRAALDIVDSLWAKIASSNVRVSYRAVTRDYYVQLIDLLFQQHKRRPGEASDVAALEINERARARGLIDLLLEPRVDIRNTAPNLLVERERTLWRQLSAKEQYRLRLLSNRQAEDERLTVENDLNSLRKEYQDTRASIQAKNSRYAALAQPPTLSLRQIQEKVLDSNTLLLEYCLGPSQSFLWSVTKTSMSSHPLPARVEIEAVARRVYELLTARNNHPRGETPQQRVKRISRADAEYSQASLALSQMLLGPVAEELGNKRLVFVTDGILQYIPFAALPAPASVSQLRHKPGESEPQPLIIDHEIVNLPSASVLAILRQENGNRKEASKSIAVIADPVFSKDDPRIDVRTAANSPMQPIKSDDGGVSRTDSSNNEFRVSKFLRLRFSREEADEIISLAPASTTLKLTDFNASTEMLIRSNLDQYRILHFATHGLLDSRRPEFSGLVLSRVNNKGEPRDGFLGLGEIYNLRLNADLVVLSGCQTALGKEVKGEGLIGLTRGFMYAGVPRVVASLWSIDDRATAELMKRFYGSVLGQGMRPAAALKIAQTELRQDRGWVAPYYWAGFTLQGDWR